MGKEKPNPYQKFMRENGVEKGKTIIEVLTTARHAYRGNYLDFSEWGTLLMETEDGVKVLIPFKRIAHLIIEPEEKAK